MQKRSRAYDEMRRDQENFEEDVSRSLKKTAKNALIFSIFLWLFVYSISRTRAVYVDPYGHVHDYRLVNINGTPYMQRDPNPSNYYPGAGPQAGPPGFTRQY